MRDVDVFNDVGADVDDVKNGGLPFCNSSAKARTKKQKHVHISDIFLLFPCRMGRETCRSLRTIVNLGTVPGLECLFDRHRLSFHRNAS